MMTEMEENIVKFIERMNGGVTFVELSKHIKGFGGGDMSIGPDTNSVSNIVFWIGLTTEGAAALSTLLRNKKIHWRSSSTLTYFVDGAALKLPLAKRVRHYKELHWLPVSFYPGPAVSE